MSDRCQFQSNFAPQFQSKSAPVGIRWNAHGPSLALAAAAKRARGHGRADFFNQVYSAWCSSGDAGFLLGGSFRRSSPEYGHGASGDREARR